MSEAPKILPTDVAGERMAAMWAKVGDLLEARAYEAAASGESASALRLARCASVALWQATGDGDFGTLKDVAALP